MDALSTINCQRPWGSPLDPMEEIISSQWPVGIILIHKPHRIHSMIKSEFCNDSQLTKIVNGSTLA